LKTAVRWNKVAEATYQWTAVPAFSRNPTKRIAGKSKGYFTDTDLARWLQRIIAANPKRAAVPWWVL